MWAINPFQSIHPVPALLIEVSAPDPPRKATCRALTGCRGLRRDRDGGRRRTMTDLLLVRDDGTFAVGTSTARANS